MCPCGGKLVPYPPIVLPDGSMLPRLQCDKCGTVYE